MPGICHKCCLSECAASKEKGSDSECLHAYFFFYLAVVLVENLKLEEISITVNLHMSETAHSSLKGKWYWGVFYFVVMPEEPREEISNTLMKSHCDGFMCKYTPEGTEYS